MKIIILLAICCIGALADDVRKDLLEHIEEFSEELEQLPEVEDFAEKSFINVVRLTMDVWLQFGANIKTILQADDSTQPDLNPILHKITKRIEYQHVGGTFMVAHEQASFDVIEILPYEYDQIAASAKTLSQHFDRLVVLIRGMIDDYRDEAAENGKRKSLRQNIERANSATQNEDDLFQDIARELDGLWYSIMNHLELEEELREIEDLENSTNDLDEADDLLTEWTQREPAKALIARLLVPLVEILQQVGQRIDALKTVNVKLRQLDWIMCVLYLNNSYRFQTSASELLFIAKYLKDVDDAKISQLDPEDIQDFRAKESLISRNLEKLVSLSEEMVTRIESETSNNSDIRLDWWDRLHNLLENGEAIEIMLTKILKTLPAPVHGQSVNHYTAASSNFKSQLENILDRLGSGSRPFLDDL